MMLVPGHADDVVTLPLGYGRTGCRDGAGPSASTPARCAAWTRPGSTPARTSPRRARRTSCVSTQDHWSTMAPDGPGLHAGRVEGQGRPPRQERLARTRGDGEETWTRRATSPTTWRPTATTRPSTSGAWPSTSTRAPAAAPAWSPASRRTTSRWWARSRSRKGREMHWLRIDRYFTGDDGRPRAWSPSRWPACTARTRPASTSARSTPPSTATRASTRWSTTAASARGTARNNCPYKVRRFNFLNYTSDVRAGAEQMGMNPDVTVRTAA